MDASQLATLPLFSGVARAELERLHKLCPSVEFQPGDVVFAQGDPSSHALLVLSGALEATTDAGGARTVLGKVHAGDLTGESGLMVLEERRGATLTATHRVRALRISPSDMAQLRGTRVLAALQIRMLNSTAARLRSTNKKMQSIARQHRDELAAPSADTAQAVRGPSGWRAFLSALGGLA